MGGRTAYDPRDDFRPNWAIILITTVAVLLLPRALGEPHGRTITLWLLLLVLATWILDPLILAIGIITISLTQAAASHWLSLTPEWSPHALSIWLTIAVVQLVRGDVQTHQSLLRKNAQYTAEVIDRRRKQQEWYALFHNSPAAILTADGDGRILMGNPAARKLFGSEDRPLEGQSLAPTLGALGAALRIDRKTTLFHSIHGCTGRRPNGEMFVADAWFSIHETPSGTRLGAVIVDASERLQERARGSFRTSMTTSQIAMSAVLHELRNLSSAAALIYANLAKAGAQSNADFEALGSLLKAVNTLAATELRPGEGELGSVDLAAVLAQLRIIVDPWCSESEVEVAWDIAAGLPNVYGDEAGLLQIFVNLVQNSNRAMLSSKQKNLTIEAREEGPWAVVRFRDTGPGVANPDELFEPFRSGVAIKGLGLFISRAIAHSLHGDLRYAKVPSGSCFIVELLPLRA